MTEHVLIRPGRAGGWLIEWDDFDHGVAEAEAAGSILRAKDWAGDHYGVRRWKQLDNGHWVADKWEER